MFGRLMVLFMIANVAPAGAQPIAEQARENAKANLQRVKEFVAEPGQLQSALDACAAGKGPFHPDTPQMPAKGSELVLQLCKLFPHDGPRPPTDCEFERFNACEIEFKNNLELEASVSQSTARGGWSINYRDTGLAMIRCEPIAVVGVLPRWVCATGAAFQLIREEVQPPNDPTARNTVELMKNSFRERNSNPLSASALSEFLRSVRPPQ
jgi:hypothetical protein